ncbi:membrane hypothetical protein [Vibrio chagasii]|nr:membrane hypothetical protein [Vibrio chagasii]CAH7301014.1 membrane hypothetical protein [Vibrio chagasii]
MLNYRQHFFDVEKATIDRLGKKYRENLTPEFYVARRNLFVASTVALFLIFLVWQRENIDEYTVKLSFIITQDIDARALLVFLALSTAYLLVRFYVIGNAAFISLFKSNRHIFISQIYLNHFNAELTRRLEEWAKLNSQAPHPNRPYSQLQAHGAIVTEYEKIWEVTYIFEYKHLVHVPKDVIRSTLSTLGMTVKEDSPTDIKIAREVHIDPTLLSQQKNIERYLRMADHANFIDVYFPAYYSLFSIVGVIVIVINKSLLIPSLFIFGFLSLISIPFLCQLKELYKKIHRKNI